MENLKTEFSFNTYARKPILRQQYRTQMGIMSEILQIIMDNGIEGAIVSEVSRKANLSYYATVENCQKLINASLVESTRTGRNYVYVITTKGIEFFRELKKF
jgi:predicted transcriptional regulator